MADLPTACKTGFPVAAAADRQAEFGSGGGATVPGAPLNPVATSNGTSQTATVSFNPPASDGGSPITGYTVTANPGGIQASGAASPINVTGLTNNTDYTFTVTATNAIGTGPASSASNSVRVESLGAELATAFNSGNWSVVTGTGASVDASGIHFVNASNLATIGQEVTAIADATLYKCVVTIANVGAPNNGTAQLRLYGATNNNVGIPPDPTLAAGTVTDYVTTNQAGTATTTAIRMRCSGTSGNNNFDVTAISVRQVL